MSAKVNTKSSRTTTQLVSPDLLAQRQYIERIEQKGFDFSLVVADAFVRGIRDIGYKSTATALDELIDNSIQAEAQNIHVIFGYGANSDAKPERLAVIDDGHGMDPTMIRLSVIWGGTHREDDRTGFGRYGYGLPSASISQGRQFSVYSKGEDGDWNRVTLDLDAISQGKHLDHNGKIVVPPFQAAQIPDWVQDYLNQQRDGMPLRSGTIVVIDKLDRLTWKTKSRLERNLLEHFGIIYRNFLRNVNIVVNGKRAEPADPLFITPGYRFYDLDEDRAEALEPLNIDVKDRDSREVLGTLRVRFAYFPPTFGRKDKTRGDSQNTNARFSIMKEHNGIIILRNGRQIDVVRWPDQTFMNYDRYWKVEVDFPATLDEEFSITTSKQQVVVSDRIWDILKEHGVLNAISKNLRPRVKRAFAELKERLDQEGKQRASEVVMHEAEKFKTRKPAGDPVERQRKSQERFEQEVRRRVEETGLPYQEVERQFLTETQGRPYRVQNFATPGAPFFYIEQIGGQKVLYLNTAHRFYTDVHSGPGSTPRLRAALELLLFVLGECELDANDERQLFYQTERNVWSDRLNVALQKLDQIQNVEEELEQTAVEDEDQDVENNQPSLFETDGKGMVLCG